MILSKKNHILCFFVTKRGFLIIIFLLVSKPVIKQGFGYHFNFLFLLLFERNQNPILIHF